MIGDLKIDPQLILLLTTIVGFVVTAWREQRTRRWAAEDRAAATAEIINKAAAEAEATRIKNAVLAESIRIEALRVATTVRDDMEKTALRLSVETMRSADAVRVTAQQTVATALSEAKAIRDEQRDYRTEHRQQSAVLAGAIEATKQAANEAYKEANHVNLKIEDLNRRLEGQQVAADKAQAVAANVGTATLDRVVSLQTDGTQVARDVKTVVTDIKQRLVPRVEETPPRLDHIQESVDSAAVLAAENNELLKQKRDAKRVTET